MGRIASSFYNLSRNFFCNFTNTFQLVEIKELKFSNSSLENYLYIKLRYKSETDLKKRLMYRYKIEFSTSFIDAALEVAPLSSCDHLPGNTKTLLPFSVTNLTTGKKIKMQQGVLMPLGKKITI